MEDTFNNQPQFRQAPSLPDQVAGFLEAEIDKGTFRSGETLPTEAELAQKFGVSRTVIREALARLKYDGLLTSRQGVGAVISPAGQRKAFRLETAALVEDGEVARLYEFRAILESEAAYLAALRRESRDLEEMRSFIGGMARAVESGADGVEEDASFHMGVARAAGNPFLLQFMGFLHLKLRGVIHRARSHSSLTPALPPLVQKEHEAIYQAIEAKDPEAARQAAHAHLMKAAARLGLTILSKE